MRDHHERPVRESDGVLVPKVLTKDIRALFSGHGFEFVLCGIGPRQQVVDLAIWIIVNDPGEDV
jgi:hypothetical protein